MNWTWLNLLLTRSILIPKQKFCFWNHNSHHHTFTHGEQDSDTELNIAVAAAVLAHQMWLEDRLSPSQIPLFPLFAAPPWCAIKLLRGLAACLSHLHHQGWRLLLMVGVLLGSQLRRIRSSFLKPFAIHLRFLSLWMMTDSVKLLIVAF